MEVPLNMPANHATVADTDIKAGLLVSVAYLLYHTFGLGLAAIQGPLGKEQLLKQEQQIH